MRAHCDADRADAGRLFDQGVRWARARPEARPSRFWHPAYRAGFLYARHPGGGTSLEGARAAAVAAAKRAEG